MRGSTLSVAAAREVLEDLVEATHATEPSLLAPMDSLKRFSIVVRSIAPRDVQHRYRLDGFHGVTIGRLHWHAAALLHDFNGLVEDNPQLRAKPQDAGYRVRSSSTPSKTT